MPTVEERFNAKTRRNEETGCLEWTGAIKKPSSRDFQSGGQSLEHGVFWYEGRTEGAHRVAVALRTGVPVRSLPLIGHLCDNPRCVEFSHLEPSSFSQNLKDAWDRGRRNVDREKNLVELTDYFAHVGRANRDANLDPGETTCSTSAT